MKNKSIIFFIILLLFAFSFEDSFAQRKSQKRIKKRRWSVELLTGTESFVNEVGNQVDMGLNLGVKIERRNNSRFGYYGSFFYSTFPSYSIDQSFEDYKYSLSSISLSAGTSWYILSTNLSKDFTPYIGIEFGYTFFSEELDRDGTDFDKTEIIMTQAISPVLGFDYPLSEQLALTGRLKYMIHLFGATEYGSGFALDFNSLNVNVGLNILIR